jgi:hypothetical protein
LIPYAIRGALWYQVESNNGEGMLYTEKMKALISGWRKDFSHSSAVLAHDADKRVVYFCHDAFD